MSIYGDLINNVIEFKYLGGSNYGAIRRIKVTEQTLKTVAGIEVNANLENIGGYKKFMKSKMQYINVITKNTFETARIELETFLNGNKDYADVLVKEFNKKWNVNYSYVNKKLVEIPKTSTKNLAILLTKDNLTGEVSGKLGALKWLINQSGYLYVNGIYCGCAGEGLHSLFK